MMARTIRHLSLLSLAMAAHVASTARLAAQSVPHPRDHLGHEVGADRMLADWGQIGAYLTRLAASPAVRVDTLGPTTAGLPFLAVTISHPDNMRRLEDIRRVEARLADPRGLTAEDEAALVRTQPAVVLISNNIHGNEIASSQMAMELAWRLATNDTLQEALRHVVLLMFPSMNPDGQQMITEWYRQGVGTPFEGGPIPWLYHPYVGHDNNRDWYAFTQPETRYTIDSLYGPWVPQIVNDIHQQQSNAGRIFIPPYMDPLEPNIDPILTAATNSLGMAMSWRMVADGKVGIATNASYDQWSPARQFSLNHRGVRILTETASARLATPIDIPFNALGTARGYDAKVQSWNFPVLWKGGRWGIGDIVDYQSSATWALLSQAARDRRQWLAGYATLGERALAANHPWTMDSLVPTAYVIPKGQRDPQAVQRLLWTLQHGMVEVRETTAPVAAGGATLPSGSYAVVIRQNFGSYANALLQPQRYPNLREYPGGPPKRPYDVTAHTLPLLFGVDAIPVFGEVPVSRAPIAAVAEPAYSVAGLTGNASRRIGIYKSYGASMDEGWTRWIFDSYKVPYASVFDRDLRAGRLNDRFDVIILPDQSAGAIARGLGGNYPDSLRGGVGEAGARALNEFVENGGTVLAFNEASDYAIETFKLPVKNVLAGVRNTEFYAPGSLFKVTLDRANPIAAGHTATTAAVWFEDSPTFEITDPARARAVATYEASGNPLLSGWLLGAERLNGKAAMVEATAGKGKVILYGFRPQYRGQSVSTLPLIWDAIGRGPAQ
ncbi:MAG: M14 family zinc carboxypeptidase [Gemmatimonadota bacterium]